MPAPWGAGGDALALPSVSRGEALAPAGDALAPTSPPAGDVRVD